MPMNRNNYREIAKCINCSLDYHTNKRINTANLLATLCDYFKENNPRFNAEKFKDACLTEEGE